MKGHCILAVLSLMAPGLSFACGGVGAENHLNILGIGNSWTRDSFRYIYGIAESAGADVTVAHGYLGGSTLEDQFFGIDDETYSYNHNGVRQLVHSTYQYWLYDGSDNPLKTPADSEYRNGLNGVGVTLESILRDRDWDIIIFQPSLSFMARLPLYLGKDGHSSFSMAKFVEKVLSLLPEGRADKVKIGLMVPWSYAEGCTRHSPVAYKWNGGSEPSDQAGWDACFGALYKGIQKNAVELSRSMGRKCDYYVNVGRAVHIARSNPLFDNCGYKLQRKQDNTHLAEGVAKYAASLMFAYQVLGVKPFQITYCPSTYDFTPELAAAARASSWKAAKCR